MEIEDHYSQLLGTQLPWEISKVALDMSAHRVDIEIEYTDVTGACLLQAGLPGVWSELSQA